MQTRNVTLRTDLEEKPVTKDTSKVFLLAALIYFFMGVIFFDQASTVKDILNLYTIIHFWIGVCWGTINRNVLAATLWAVTFEIFELSICFPLGTCMPRELFLDTMVDIIVCPLGMIVGIGIVWRNFLPLKQQIKTLVPDLMYLFITGVFLQGLIYFAGMLSSPYALPNEIDKWIKILGLGFKFLFDINIY